MTRMVTTDPERPVEHDITAFETLTSRSPGNYVTPDQVVIVLRASAQWERQALVACGTRHGTREREQSR
ncbi:hypothetical protein J6590_039556 [Homalodisca vitripennis]|nr:hypothetical protein J6590_039556 [Homalodisca vitripennis]